MVDAAGASEGRDLSSAALRPQQFLSQWATGDESERTSLLDSAASQAAAGSERALESLLTVIDNDGLAIPAIRRLLVDHHAVTEVAQDVLVAVATSISNFRGDSRFSTWLYAVAQNQARMYLRRQTRSRSEEPVEERPAKRVSSLIADRGAVDAALNGLPDAYREAVVLRDVEQYTYEEIANTLAIEMNTVRSRISRGRALVAAAMDMV